MIVLAELFGAVCILLSAWPAPFSLWSLFFFTGIRLAVFFIMAGIFHACYVIQQGSQATPSVLVLGSVLIVLKAGTRFPPETHVWQWGCCAVILYSLSMPLHARAMQAWRVWRAEQGPDPWRNRGRRRD